MSGSVARVVHLVLTWAGMAALATIVVATGLGVVGRYLHLGGVTWSFELVAMAFLWITAIGTILAEVVGENVSVDGTSVDRGAFFRVYHALVLLAVSAALVWSGWAMLRRTGFMPTPVMRAPTWTMQGVIVVMGIALGVIALLRIVRKPG
jgi:TRAP-type C4-dicarboxylate transport system permease small subunit